MNKFLLSASAIGILVLALASCGSSKQVAPYYYPQQQPRQQPQSTPRWRILPHLHSPRCESVRWTNASIWQTRKANG